MEAVKGCHVAQMVWAEIIKSVLRVALLFFFSTQKLIGRFMQLIGQRLRSPGVPVLNQSCLEGNNENQQYYWPGGQDFCWAPYKCRIRPIVTGSTYGHVIVFAKSTVSL